jgi:cell division protein FtsB
MNTNRLLAAVLVLQVLTLAGQWGANAVRDARADLPPDPGAQRIAQTEELKAVNQNLSRLIGLLESGRVRVEVGNIKELKDNGNARK